jgi:hypothetical protein
MNGLNHTQDITKMAQTPAERRRAQRASAKAVKKGAPKSKVGERSRRAAKTAEATGGDLSAKGTLSDKQFTSTKSAASSSANVTSTSAPSKFDDRGGRPGRNISGTIPPAAPSYIGKHRGSGSNSKDLTGVAKTGSEAQGRHAKSGKNARFGRHAN